MFLLYGFARSLKALAEYLTKNNSDFIIYDDRKSALEQAQELGYATTQTPKETNPALLVITPGIRPDNDLVLWAHENKIPVTNDIDLFFQATARKDNIAVTGTFGKSSCVWAIYTLWNCISESKTQVGGNIGVPVFSLDINQHAIIELSAQQLGFCSDIPLKIAMILNLFPQHLDFYETLEDYYDAKIRIFDAAEICICNIDDVELIEFVHKGDPDKKFITISDDNIEADYAFVGSAIYEKSAMVAEYDSTISAISFIGAYAALRESGFSSQEILTHDITALPHRGELVQNTGAKVIINDSKSTNLMNSVYLVQKYASQRPAVILGGKLTPQDLAVLDDIIPSAAIFILTGQSADDLHKHIQSRGGHSVKADSLADAVKLASEHSVILFTPGYPSTDQYRDFEHRGDEFKRIVNEVFSQDSEYS